MTTLLLALAFTRHQMVLNLPNIFSDNMVLQRNMPIPVFGDAVPGKAVEVSLGSNKVRTIADQAGRWRLNLPSMSAGGPFTMSVESDGTQSFKNVMVGEVWVCSGQSNMEFPAKQEAGFGQELGSTSSNVRMFTVLKVSKEDPASDVRGAWVAASPATIGAFSAVGYQFAKELYQKLHVPIGMIHTSWGGTPAESWTSRHALQRDPALKPLVDRYLAQLGDFPARKAAYDNEMADWISGRHDGSNDGYDRGWTYPILNEADWTSANLPDTIENVLKDPELDGTVWFRRKFDLPEAWYGKSARIELGPIDDYDDTYVNGSKVGQTKQDNESASITPRSYRISPGVLRKGSNTIAIRVFDSGGPGGFTGKTEQMRIVGEDGTSISISGEWKAKLERKLDKTKQPPGRPMGPGNPWAPGGLYNGMIAPLVPYGIKGALWYQGEANADRGAEYGRLMPTLIQDWRRAWGQGQFPFYLVQLPNFMARQAQPSESAWAELREAQMKTLKTVKKTGIAVTIDLGEADNIHPKEKKTVAHRLAIQALANDYGISITHGSPVLREVRIAGPEVRVFFDNVGEGLATSDGGPAKGFALAGADHKWYWADGKLSGTTIIVTCKDVPNPVAVRYAWADNPDCNVVNRAGLPASPFRSDKWPRTP